MNGKLTLERETLESSLRGGWTSEARLVWEDEHGRLFLLRSSEHGADILGVRVSDVAIANRVKAVLGSHSPNMVNLPGWGLTGIEGTACKPFFGSTLPLRALVESAYSIAKEQYADGLRAQADRVEAGYPVEAGRVWEKPEYDSARRFCMRKITPELRVKW